MGQPVKHLTNIAGATRPEVPPYKRLESVPALRYGQRDLPRARQQAGACAPASQPSVPGAFHGGLRLFRTALVFFRTRAVFCDFQVARVYLNQTKGVCGIVSGS